MTGRPPRLEKLPRAGRGRRSGGRTRRGGSGAGGSGCRCGLCRARGSCCRGSWLPLGGAAGRLWALRGAGLGPEPLWSRSRALRREQRLIPAPGEEPVRPRGGEDVPGECPGGSGSGSVLGASPLVLLQAGEGGPVPRQGSPGAGGCWGCRGGPAVLSRGRAGLGGVGGWAVGAGGSGQSRWPRWAGGAGGFGRGGFCSSSAWGAAVCPRLWGSAPVLFLGGLCFGGLHLWVLVCASFVAGLCTHCVWVSAPVVLELVQLLLSGFCTCWFCCPHISWCVHLFCWE